MTTRGAAHDVVVVGGGPVGLATAIAARRHGLSVLVVERQRPPIDKACGEGLMPAGVAALAALGVPIPQRSMPFRGIRYVSDGVVAEGDFPGPKMGLPTTQSGFSATEMGLSATEVGFPSSSVGHLTTEGAGRGIRRTVLHAALVDRAAACGVEVSWGERVEAVAPGEVRTAGATWPCRFVVGADGLHSHVRAVAGLERAGRRGAATKRWSAQARFGVARHLRLAPWSERVEVTFGRAAEAYVTPLGPDELGVAILWSGGKAGFAELLATRLPPGLAARLAGAEVLGRDHGAGPLLQPTRGAVAAAARIALVGDAAGYVDALTGEGLSLGFEAALALGEALAADDLPRYAKRLARLAAVPLGLTRLLLVAARRPWLRRRLVAGFAADPQLFSICLGLLGARRPLTDLPPARLARLAGRLAWPFPPAFPGLRATSA